MNMKINKCGFSLMQMMVVLLVVAITAAASAPILTRKAPDKAGGLSPWKIVQGGSIAFGSANANSKVLIGRAYAPRGVKAKLYVDAPDIPGVDANGNEITTTIPQIALGTGSNNPHRLWTTDANGIGISQSNVLPRDNGIFISDMVTVASDQDLGGRTLREARVSIGANASNDSALANMVAIGSNATAGMSSVVIGSGNNVNNIRTKAGSSSVVIGYDAQVNKGENVAPANQAVILGSGATIVALEENADSQVIGANASSGPRAIAVGLSSHAGTGAVALGQSQAQAGAVAIGASASSAVNSIALGVSASSESNSVAIGNNVSSYEGAVAIGAKNQSSDNDNQQATQASAGAVAIGQGANAFSDEGAPVAIGSRSSASSYAVAVGHNTNASGANSVALGVISNAATGSVALGGNALATGVNSISLGARSSVTGKNSIAIGCNVDKDTDDAVLENHIRIGKEDHVFYIPAEKVSIGTVESSGSKEVTLGKPATEVRIPGKLEANNLDLSLLDGIITIGNSNSTVYIPGNLVVGGDVLFDKQESIWFYTNDNSWREDNSNHFRSKYIPMTKIHKTYSADRYTIGVPNRLNNMSYPVNERPSFASFLNDSDRRLKNVGEVFTAGLEEIKKLELFHYTYKKDPDKTPQVGVMAQDLEKVFPTAVFKGDDGFLRIRWDEMFFALINAVKELDAKIEKTFSKYTRIAELQQQVVDLKAQNTEMKNQVLELKDMLKEMNEDLESLN